VHPAGITLAAFAIGLASAVCAGFGALRAAAVLWVINRIVDGMDGAVARAGGTQSDFGGYLDLLLDVVVYSAIPIGFALHRQNGTLFVVVMILLASFYINVTSWLYLSALLEKRGHRTGGILPPDTGSTSIAMPGGVVEGGETILFYLAVLLFPASAVTLLTIMAVATLVSAAQRICWALRTID
jgi:phosphatidylglycerophosphate synthase